MAIDDEIRTIENRLTSLDKERTDLLNDLKKLRLQRDDQKSIVLLGRPTLLKSPETNDKKTDLFLTLFRSREDIFPKRWDNPKTGRVSEMRLR
jgi:hypothetical protein